ncbi:MAG: GTPase HflX [Syntrophomonadaceae bacterium]|nr:GTPase HflX [Bacillota bacterium]
METAILVGLQTAKAGLATEETMRELAQLVKTAGAEPAAEVVQKRPAADSAYYVGKGKAEEIAVLAKEIAADCVVFDDELSPVQIRNLEAVTGVRVVDRTALILDIFAGRARTREGKLQVELAQANYLLPRLTGRGEAMSRLGGGIGTRGPGEKKLETDRRVLRERIVDLRRELEEVKKHRSLHRQSRQAIPLPVVTLVGYTNAGKSTLLNALTGAETLVEDKLFATLDPTTRRVRLPGGREFLLTDTVGFIRKLPHHLVAAFRATLEEVLQADLLLHVVDTAHPQAAEQIEAVMDVLRQLAAADRPMLLVFNKLDEPLAKTALPALSRGYPDHVAVSAQNKEGLAELLRKTEALLQHDDCRISLMLPLGRDDLLAIMRRHGKVDSAEYTAGGIDVRATLPRLWAAKISAFLNSPERSAGGDS